MSFSALTTFEKSAVIVASMSLAAASLSFVLGFKLPPTYVDFVVGFPAWGAHSKSQDLLSLPTFMATLIVGSLLLRKLTVQLRARHGQALLDEFCTQLLWWSVPFGATVSGMILGSQVDRSMLAISAVGLTCIMATTAFSLWKGQEIKPSEVGLGLFGMLLVGLIPLEVALCLGRMSAAFERIGHIDLARIVVITRFLTVAGMLSASCLAVFMPAFSDRWLPRILLIGQIGLSALYLTLYPAQLSTPNMGVISYNTTTWLKVLTAALVAWSVFDVLHRFRAHYSDTGPRHLSPVSLFALIVALRVGSTMAPSIPADDYHFGEALIGWWSYMNGHIPYVDHYLIRGLLEDDLPGFVMVMFFDQTVATLIESLRISFAIPAFIAFLSLYRLTGNIGLSFVSMLFLGGRPSWLLLTAFMCLWLFEEIRGRPARWLSVYILTAPLVILGDAARGLSLVSAFGPYALFNTWRLWRQPEKRRLAVVGIAAGVLLLFAFLTPLGSMLVGAVRYVFENGPINQVAHGIPWELSWSVPGPHSGLVFEVIRMSWLITPLISVAVILKTYKDTSLHESAFFPALAVLLLSLLLMPYALGRIDPGGVSRPGMQAIFGWAVLIPVMVRPFADKVGRSVLVFIIAAACSALGSVGLSIPALYNAMSAKVATAPLTDGSALGLPHAGLGAFQEDHLLRLTRLNAVLNEHLEPTETYLDLTSRNAQYYFLNRLPAVPVTAPYNMVPPSQQRRTVELLERKLPRIALLEGENVLFDGGGLAFRNPILYRFVLDNYIPFYKNGFVLGYRREDEHLDGTHEASIPIKKLTDATWDRGVNRLEPALLLKDTSPLAGVRAGSTVSLGNGELRQITKISSETGIIWLDGGGLDPSAVGEPHCIRAGIEPDLLGEYRLSLLDKAFRTPELAKLPVAWGSSDSSLRKKLDFVVNLDATSPTARDMAWQDESYKTRGGAPEIYVDVSSLALSGNDAGILRFEFSCIGKRAEPRFRVLWWGDDQSGPLESTTLRFTADDGPLIVPLDAYPRWVSLKQVKGIQIAFDNADACEESSVQNISLYQRSAFHK